jgi:hypothetical protein
MTSICKWPSSDIVMRFPSAFTSSPFFVLQSQYYTQYKLRSTIKYWNVQEVYSALNC